VLLENEVVREIVKELPAYCGTPMFKTVFNRPRNLPQT